MDVFSRMMARQNVGEIIMMVRVVYQLDSRMFGVSQQLILVRLVPSRMIDILFVGDSIVVHTSYRLHLQHKNLSVWIAMLVLDSSECEKMEVQQSIFHQSFLNILQVISRKIIQILKQWFDIVQSSKTVASHVDDMDHENLQVSQILFMRAFSMEVPQVVIFPQQEFLNVLVDEIALLQHFIIVVMFMNLQYAVVITICGVL